MSLKKLIEYQAEPNIADKLSDDDLKDIGHMVVRDYNVDNDSRTNYIEQMKEAIKIAKQVEEIKTYPWPDAANVKYPLITSASIQFASRTYPEIVKGNRVVKCAVLGDDPEGKKEALAAQISKQMSDQLLIYSNEWDPGTDRLLHMLPILGTVFRKTYWHEIAGHSRSEVCTPDEIVLNANVKSLEDARRISHIIYQYKNDIQSRINAGLYSDVDISCPDTMYADRPIKEAGDKDAGYDLLDADAPHIILEQHRYLDLDDDGYEEPYIVTVDLKSQKVLRIVARFDLDGIKLADNSQKIIKITPINYFTAYIFIPDPCGGFYGIGFGQLLLPINKMINTLLNQLIDSGTLANMQGGFFGRGVRFKNGKITPKPGEWIPLEAAAGSSLKDNIIPFPFKEPSNVLYQLLGLMMQSGKELSSVSDAMQGQEQAQNVPATTILALIEQGNKVFGAIQKRLYRSFKQEFEKIFRLNRLYLDGSNYNLDYQKINGNANANPTGSDYADPQIDVCPVADPTISSETQRMARIQALMQIMPQLSPAGQDYAKGMYLKALQFTDSDIQALMAPPQGPSPEAMKMDAEIKKITAEANEITMKPMAEQIKMQLEQGNQELEVKKVEIQAIQAMAMMKQSEASMVTAITNAETGRIKASTELHTVAKTATSTAETGEASASQLTSADAERYTQAAEILVNPDSMISNQQGNPNGQSDQATMAPIQAGSADAAIPPPPPPTEAGPEGAVVMPGNA